MKSIKQITTLGFYFFLMVIIGISCKKYKCEEPADISNSGVILILKNVNDQYLYTEIQPLYNKDSLGVFDELGNKLSLVSNSKQIPNTPLAYWAFDFGPIYNPLVDAMAFENEWCKKFIIKYYHNKADTITTCYKAYKFDCGSEFSTMKVFHKGVLLNEVNNTIYTTVTILKN